MVRVVADDGLVVVERIVETVDNTAGCGDRSTGKVETRTRKQNSTRVICQPNLLQFTVRESYFIYIGTLVSINQEICR